MGKYVIALLLILVGQWAVAQQQYLYLYRPGKTQSTKYLANEPIRFMFKGDSVFSQGIITGFGDSLLYFDKYAIPLDTIQAIDIRYKSYHNSGIRNGAGVLATAGIGYVVIDWFNRRVVSGGKGGLDRRVAISAAGLLATSVLLNASKKKVFKVDGGHRIIIINKDKIKVD